MTHQEAVDLISQAYIRKGDKWADLGAGSGRFSLAIAELLGPEGAVYAIDTKISSILTSKNMAPVFIKKADFTQPLDLPLLDGILMANSLHYVKDQARFLRSISSYVKPRGNFLFIEYDMTKGNPWVPYPVPFSSLVELCKTVGFSSPRRINEKISLYGNGMIYVAEVEKKD